MTTDPWRTREPWLPITELRTKTVLEAIALLDVENTPRYQPNPGQGLTYCNIFALDVLAVLGLDTPSYWHDPVTGERAAVGQGAEMNTNLLHAWMANHGIEKGWRFDKDMASLGQLTQKSKVSLAIWTNPGGPGHVGVIRPDAPGACAQAGLVCDSKRTLLKAFGIKLPQVAFWTFGGPK